MEKMTLAGKTFTVVRMGEHGADLLGPRGAKYALVQNLAKPELFALVPFGSPKRTTWFRKVGETYTEV